MRQRYSLEVNHDPDTVFGFLADPRNLETWVPAVQEIELSDGEGPPIREGDRFRQRVFTDTEQEEAWFEARVHELSDPDRVCFVTMGETGPIETAFTLTTCPEGTRVTESLEVPLEGWATKVLAPFLWIANRSRMKRQLEALKTTLEDRDRADPPRQQV